MYTPAAFKWDDVERMHALMREYSFATLVCGGDTVSVSHIPLLLDSAGGQHGLLFGHMARGNDHVHQIASGEKTLAVFIGPHAYISPTWYTSEPNVPTWNYAAVHAHCVGRPLEHDELLHHLQEMVLTYDPQAASNPPPSDYLLSMARGVIGFELTIQRLEGKLKMSQNKPDADALSAAETLSGAGSAASTKTAQLMVDARNRA